MWSATKQINSVTGFHNFLHSKVSDFSLQRRKWFVHWMILCPSPKLCSNLKTVILLRTIRWVWCLKKSFANKKFRNNFFLENLVNLSPWTYNNLFSIHFVSYFETHKKNTVLQARYLKNSCKLSAVWKVSWRHLNAGS